MRDIEFLIWLAVLLKAIFLGVVVFLLLTGMVLGQMYDWHQQWAATPYVDARPEVLRGR